MIVDNWIVELEVKPQAHLAVGLGCEGARNLGGQVLGTWGLSEPLLLNF